MRLSVCHVLESVIVGELFDFIDVEIGMGVPFLVADGFGVHGRGFV